MTFLFNSDTRAGTIVGTMLVIIANLDSGEMLKTGILAGFGALVSFVVSTILKWLHSRYKK